MTECTSLSREWLCARASLNIYTSHRYPGHKTEDEANRNGIANGSEEFYHHGPLYQNEIKRNPLR